ncbi:MAG TPA: hypothetical protein VNX21_06160 [Candidatus Thermoplasmatota archaeon]|nr:hypothetical protein [Candidatus Thermoplasmatota archaeon]
MRPERLLVLLAWAQGAYYVATGAWPMLHVDSFQWVTGPKTDVWLVRTVAVLVLAIGATLLLSAWRLRVGPEAVLLAVLSALGLGALEVVYVLDGTLRPVYAADAAVEFLLVGAWLAAAWRAGRGWWAVNAQVRGRAS